MMPVKRWHLLPALLAALLPAVTCVARDGARPDIHFIGHYDMPPGLDLGPVGMKGVPFGGISGIDRDPRTGLFHLISDDRSQKGPARMLTVRIAADMNGIHGVSLVSATSLLDGSGIPFPASAPGRPAVDPESIRVDPLGDGLFWTSEGDPAAGGDPLLMRAAPDGTSTAFPLPPAWHFDPAGKTGPYPNMTLEGLSFLPDGSLWLAMEGPQRQDGQPPTAVQGVLTRITHLARNGAVMSQKAYPLDPIPDRPEARAVDNGVSEITHLNDHSLLVLERAGYQAASGDYEFNIRLYLADLTTGDDIAGRPSLSVRPLPVPMEKRLLFAFDGLPQDLPPFNQEGMVLFRDQPTGRCLLLTVADDNFTQAQRSRLLLFAVGDDKNTDCGF